MERNAIYRGEEKYMFHSFKIDLAFFCCSSSLKLNY